jgi:hypothetical protein
MTLVVELADFTGRPTAPFELAVALSGFDR